MAQCYNSIVSLKSWTHHSLPFSHSSPTKPFSGIQFNILRNTIKRESAAAQLHWFAINYVMFSFGVSCPQFQLDGLIVSHLWRLRGWALCVCTALLISLFLYIQRFIQETLMRYNKFSEVMCVRAFIRKEFKAISWSKVHSFKWQNESTTQGWATIPQRAGVAGGFLSSQAAVQQTWLI